MLRKYQLLPSESSERGVAMVETCVVLPFLFFLIFATYELGAALNEYLTLTRVVYEGSRYAATIPGLEKTDVTDPNSYYGTGKVNPIYQTKVYDRVTDLVNRNGFDSNSVTIKLYNENDEKVSVSVDKEFVSIFGMFNGLRINVSASGPFLSKPPTSS